MALSGTGTAAASPQLTLSASSLAFGSVTVNTPTYADPDADFDRYVGGDGELGYDYGCWLYDHRGHGPGYAGAESDADAAGAV